MIWGQMMPLRTYPKATWVNPPPVHSSLWISVDSFRSTGCPPVRPGEPARTHYDRHQREG
mgnify:CR=1 FL=1